MPTALIVEDDLDQAEMAARLLRYRNFDSEIAETGGAGLTRARELKPDVILLDLMLPDTTGFDVCRGLRADRETMLTPVVMLTALGDDLNRRKGYRVGANAYVPKPYGAEELFQAIADARAWRVRMEEGRIQGEIHVQMNSEVSFLQEVNEFLMSVTLAIPFTYEQMLSLRQALLEMGQNAIEWGNRHRSEQLVELTYRIHADRVEIVIRDQGSGFDRAKLAHAASSENPIAHMGVREKLGLREGGFGLLITNGMVDEMRHNETGNEVTLIKRFRPSEPIADESSEAKSPMIAKRPTIAVVDDEPEVLRSLYDLFRLEYRVLTFERPAEALAALELDPDVDVILSDQRMPEMTGVRFLEAAQARCPDATRLLITGYADIKAVIDAINRGHVYRYVTKPWDPDELASVIRQAIDKHAMINEKARLIRELKETNARLVEADRLKGKFIEVASHELNTPVTVVLGLSELWKMTQAPHASEAERGWVDRIHGAGKRLASSVERMLKLLKTNRISPSLAFENLELEPLIRRAIGDLQPFLVARNQEVDIRIEANLGWAEVDASKISDVMTNLVVNAIKFTPDGGTIVVEAVPLGLEHVRLQITDWGTGIHPDDCSHLFEPFFTGNDTMHHSSGEYQYCKRGMGLGLCLVKTFVELHGGQVEVDSAPGQGSTFAFTLPRRVGSTLKPAEAVR